MNFALGFFAALPLPKCASDNQWILKIKSGGIKFQYYFLGYSLSTPCATGKMSILQGEFKNVCVCVCVSLD